MKLLCLGLDGASFQLINRFTDEGKLPNFKKIMEQGIFRELTSCIPPHTAPGWVSGFTGVEQDEHGIYQFWDTQAKSYIGDFMGGSNWRKAPIWDILNHYNMKTGVINVPMSHPPKPLDGFMLSWPLSNTLRYSYPNDLIREIAKIDGHYTPDLVNMYVGDKDYIKEAISVTFKRLTTLKYLMSNKEWDFLTSVFTEIDRISHYYWKYMDEQNGKEENQILKTAIETIYITTDKIIGEIIDMIDQDTLFMIFSDHGFTRGDFDFYVQSVLLEQSLLNLKPATEKEIEKYRNSWFLCKKDDKWHCVDWSNTVAYMACPGSYGLNINLIQRQEEGCVPEERYEETRDKVIKLLRKLKNPQTNENLFKKVIKREELFQGNCVDSAPDILLIPHEYSMMVHHSIKPNIFFGEAEQNGLHSREGIIALYGKKFNRNKIKKNLSLIDIAPTILNYFGIEKPGYMKGKTIYDFGEDKFVWDIDTTNMRDHRVAYDKEERQQAEDRLKALGYL